MSDEPTGRSGSTLRTIARLLFAGAFLSIVGGGLFAAHLINKKLGSTPSQTYVPVNNTFRAGTVAADALRSKTQKWNLYRADAGYSIVAPASFTITFPRPSADVYLSDIRTEGRAIVRAARLGDRIGNTPFLTWKRGTTVAGVNALFTERLGKLENLRTDAFVAGWFNYEREDDTGTLRCVASPELLANTPVLIEACSSFGLEYDTALLNVSIPTTLSTQKSSDFTDTADEQALDQAFVDHPPVQPDPVPPKKDTKKKGHVPDSGAVAPDAASAVVLMPAPKLSPRQGWEETRSVHCYGKALPEMQACYVTEAQNEVQDLQDGGHKSDAPEASDAVEDHPGVDVVGPAGEAADSADDASDSTVNKSGSPDTDQ